MASAIEAGKEFQTGIVLEKKLNLKIRSNLNTSNTDGSLTMANSNSVLSPCEILPIDQENKYLRKLSYFIMKLYEGESISIQPNLFTVEIHPFFFDVIAL